MEALQEAIWHQKLILGIPLHIDQQKNIQRAVDLGFAEAIDILNFTSVELIVKTRMLIENPIYLNNVEKVSKLMRSQPAKPSERAIYWIEQVIQHKGLNHLKTEARKLNFYKLYMLDIGSLFGTMTFIYVLIVQYHFIKEWVLRQERKRLASEANKVMSETDKLKSE